MTTEAQDLVVSVTPRNRANFRRLKTNSIQSVKRWEKENELLYAMMEDESEWLGKLFPDVVISPEFFFYALEDGSLLCRLANYIQEKAELYSQKHNVPVPGKKFRYHTMSKCSKEIKLFRSRENVHEFLTWCRSHGIPEAILFESNDVVQVDDYREGCRGVIICLMEIVRRTAKFDLGELPQLIQMEKEIEEDETQNDTELSNGQGQVLEVEKINIEIDNLEVHSTDQPEIQSPSSLDSDSGVDSVFDQEEGENAASRLKEFSQEETEKTVKTTTTVTVQKQNLTKPKDHKSSPKKTKELPSLLDSTGPKSELDKQVCKLAQDYNIKVVHRLKEGKYIILGRIMFVRMLNDHMLVRIGGGWDTLEHYLMTHAPSKEALETPSTPSSQALSSPRNSISANSGARSSLIEKVKRKEQVGVVNRDAAVYSSQGSLNQQLGTPSSPKSRDRAKKNPLTDKDEKDITDAIRKISTSVSQTLAERPASFTSKTFHQLKVRFDKGIFGAIRRTSSPDLSLKGSKIRRRLSDTTTMADVATTLAFDGEQAPIANNNDSESKQPGETEEPSMGKVAAPVGDLLGDESLRRDVSPPEQTASDETDSVPVGDLLSMVTADQSNWTEGPSGGQVNGSTNLVDIPSFDPFAAPPDHGELISIDTASSEKTEEQPKTGSETAVESSPPVDFGDFEQDTEPESTLEFSPRPVDLGDLLLDSQTKTEDGITVEPSPAVAPGKPVEEAHPADVEQVEPVEPVASEDVPTSVQEVPLIVTEPASETVVETEPEPPKLEEESSKLEEPTPSEKPVVEPPKPEEEPVLSEMEPPKLEEPVNVEEPVPSEEAILEPPKLEEAAKVEETPKLEERVEVVEAVPSEEAIVEPRELEEPVKVDEPVSSEEGVIKTEGASSEAGPAMDETSTQEQSPAPAPPVAQVVESVPVKADEGKEGDKPAQGQTPKTEKPAEKAAKTKPAAAGPKAKSPTKPAAAAKQPATKKPTAAAARPTSPTKAPAAKKDVKAPATKATAPATKAPATKPTAAKAPGAKATTSTVAGAKKPAAKPAAAKVDEAKKAEKPKSAAATRPPSKTAGTKTPGAARPASAAATTKPAAAKAPGKDVKDAGPPKRAPKTIATRPPSTKPAAPKTTALGTKPAAAKPTRTQSAKPVDSTDSAAASKKLTARPLSAKPKATTTTTTVKKTTTTVTKSTTGPAKTQTTTTKTVTQAKSGQPKTTTTTTTTTKTTAKPSAPRPASAAKKPAATGTKSKVGAKPTAGTAGGKPAAKSAPKKKAEEPATENEVKHEEKLPVSEPEGVSEPTTGTEEKPTEVVETSTEIVESVSEEAPVEASPEDKSMELTPDSPEQAPEVSSEEFVEQSHVITRVVTNETTTVITDGEEQSTTTTEEATFEQSVGES